MFLTPIIYSTTLNTLLWKQTDMERECLQQEQYIPISSVYGKMDQAATM